MQPRCGVSAEGGLWDVRDLVNPCVASSFAVTYGTASGITVAKDTAAGGTNQGTPRGGDPCPASGRRGALGSVGEDRYDASKTPQQSRYVSGATADGLNCLYTQLAQRGTHTHRSRQRHGKE